MINFGCAVLVNLCRRRLFDCSGPIGQIPEIVPAVRRRPIEAVRQHCGAVEGIGVHRRLLNRRFNQVRGKSWPETVLFATSQNLTRQGPLAREGIHVNRLQGNLQLVLGNQKAR